MTDQVINEVVTDAASGGPGQAVATLPTLPNIEWKPLQSFSSRQGKQVELVVVHTWGSRKGSTVDGVWGYQSNPSNQVSSHFIYGGTVGPDANRLVQGVALGDKAWTNCAFNVISATIECNDTIFNYGAGAGIEQDAFGMEVVARIVAWHLHRFVLPPNWVKGTALLNGSKGFTRHADLGSAGCGHGMCPTTDMTRWSRFCDLVKREYKRGGFRPDWQPKE